VAQARREINRITLLITYALAAFGRAAWMIGWSFEADVDSDGVSGTVWSKVVRGLSRTVGAGSKLVQVALL
jgi:hypothetical protein